MNTLFHRQIFNKHKNLESVPSNEVIASWALRLTGLLFPEKGVYSYSSIHEVENEFDELEDELKKIMDATKACRHSDNKVKAKKFFDSLSELYRILNTDISAIVNGDPAARSEFEVIRAYPGFYAISFYRIAHQLLLLNIPLIPRILTEFAHSKTGIDIHPAAQIGEHLYIDHGTGIVIGETAIIGDFVKLYQGVTLGALSVDKSMAAVKRHPTVEDYVVIYSGATILGGDTVIGHNCIIGGNVWLTESVLPGSIVYHVSSTEVIERKL